jgi:hypothetical protein
MMCAPYIAMIRDYRGAPPMCNGYLSMCGAHGANFHRAQRFAAAFLAISARRSGVIFAARALPPRAPSSAAADFAESGSFSSSSPVAIRITLTALPITSAGRFSPRGPRGNDLSPVARPAGTKPIYQGRVNIFSCSGNGPTFCLANALLRALVRLSVPIVDIDVPDFELVNDRHTMILSRLLSAKHIGTGSMDRHPGGGCYNSK